MLSRAAIICGALLMLLKSTGMVLAQPQTSK
jgi:hypothetical protein